MRSPVGLPCSTLPLLEWPLKHQPLEGIQWETPAEETYGLRTELKNVAIESVSAKVWDLRSLIHRP